MKGGPCAKLHPWMQGAAAATLAHMDDPVLRAKKIVTLHHQVGLKVRHSKKGLNLTGTLTVLFAPKVIFCCALLCSPFAVWS